MASATQVNASNDKQMDIIANLSVNAPDHAIRDCIRKYNPRNTTTQHEKCFGGSSVKKEVLISTLLYLGTNANGSFKKPALVSMLIRRIQTLLPDTCAFCKQEYTVGPQELPLLTCRLCSQGSHDECVRSYIKNATGQNLDDKTSRADTQNVIKAFINPHDLPGLHYICHICESSKFPESLPFPGQATTDEDNANSENDDDDDNDDEEEDTVADDEQQHIQDPLEDGNHSDDVKDTSSSQDKTKNEDKGAAPRPPQNVCSHYAKGKCRHGMSGKGCSKNHPKPCRKLIRHGPKSKSNPHGCPGLPTCCKWHPALCRASVKNRVCTNDVCKFRHVAGTRRVAEEGSGSRNKTDGVSSSKPTADQNSTKTSTKPNDIDHFLGIMEKWKMDLMDTIETRFRMNAQMMSYPSMQYPQLHQCGMCPNHRQHSPGPTPSQSPRTHDNYTTASMMGFLPQMHHQQVAPGH